ncbi:MAG: arginine--tRNA ligase [Actinomycetota bacterium]
MRELVTRLTQAAVGKYVSEGKIQAGDVVGIDVERPRAKSFGDWSTNAAMVLAKQAKRNPMEIAEALTEYLSTETAVFKSVEAVRPGFINFRFSDKYLNDSLADIAKLGDSFGTCDVGRGEKVQIEFVSANPTGPLHVGHGRWAAVGDALANVMSAAGYDIQREFYVNDFGNQMDVFGVSVAARYAQLLGIDEAVPEEGYHGAYVTEIAQEIIDSEGEKYLAHPAEKRHDIFRRHAEEQVIEHIKRVLSTFNVVFDVWFSERSLHKAGAIDKTVARLKKLGRAYDKDGAIWVRTTEFGDDKDRVVIKENGQPTYFAADIAYHIDKFARGFDRVINIWGADHHGYVARMKAAVAALGYEPDRLEVIIGQLVNLYRNGEPVRMSKRTGEMVTFEELVQEVGPDVARYLFLTRSTDSALDFDIELAKKQSQDNPVYYVQYAHARICSILRYACDQGAESLGQNEVPVMLTEEAELDLIKQLLSLRETVEDAAILRAPYRLTKYAEETAAAFHYFYTKCRVVGDDKALTKARLNLVECTRIVLQNALALIGVSAPESM